MWFGVCGLGFGLGFGFWGSNHKLATGGPAVLMQNGADRRGVPRWMANGLCVCFRTFAVRESCNMREGCERARTRDLQNASEFHSDCVVQLVVRKTNSNTVMF